METIGGIILGLIILIILVVVHELGHAWAARRNGVVVEEFGVGFPPRAWSKKLKNKILFSLNWLPLGGFVKLQGEYDSAKSKGDYGSASYWSKTKILFAGVFMNWATAVVLFTILALIGVPKILPNQFSVGADTKLNKDNVTIVSVLDNHPASQNGLKAGDKLLKIDGREIFSPEQFVTFTKANKGKEINLEWSSGSVVTNRNIKLSSQGESGFFGASLGQGEKLQSTWSAPIIGVGLTVQLSYESFRGVGVLLGNLFGGLFQQLSFNQSTRNDGTQKLNSISESVAGPVGILGVIFPAAGKGGFESIILLSAIISLTLAVMNTLPIPALDGGRWFVMTLYKLRKKPLTKEKEEKIHGTGFMLLIGLTIIITIGDVTKLFK